MKTTNAVAPVSDGAAASSKRRKIHQTEKVEPEVKDVKRDDVFGGDLTALSAAEALVFFERSVRLAKDEPLNRRSWENLRTALQIPSLHIKRASAGTEKAIGDALRTALTSAENLSSELCFQAWVDLKNSLGFLPKLDQLTAILGAPHALTASQISFILVEYEAVILSESDRKAFEVICGDFQVFSALVRALVVDSVAEVATRILSAAIFASDAEDELVNACTGPRALAYHAKQNKKARAGQNNWRAVFWNAVKQSLPHIPAVSALCTIHRGFRGKERNVVFWFELLTCALDCENANAELVAGLVQEGLSCYEPTSDDDVGCLTKFVETVVSSNRLQNGDVVSIVQALLRLDYRVVEPSLAPLLTKCDSDKSSSCDLLLAYLDSFLATRRAHVWIEMLPRLVAKDFFSGNAEDLTLQLSITERMGEMLTSKLLEMYVPQAWKAFEDAIVATEFNHSFLLCALNAFLASLSCEKSADEAAKQTIARIEDECASKHLVIASSGHETAKQSKKKSKKDATVASIETSPLILCAVLLVRTCALYLDLSGSRPTSEVPDAVKAALKVMASVHSVVAPIRKEIVKTCACLGLDLPSALDAVPSLLSSRATLHCAEDLSEEEAAEWWAQIMSSSESAQVLALAPVFELKGLRSGFCALLESYNDSALISSLVRLACEFPSGYLSEDDISRITAVIRKQSKRMEPGVVGRFILTFPRVVDDLVGGTLDKVKAFSDKLKNLDVKGKLLELFVARAVPRELKSITDVVEDPELGLIILSSLANRLQQQENDDSESLVGIARSCLAASENLKGSVNELDLGARRLDLVCAITRASSNDQSLPFHLDLGQLLASTCSGHERSSLDFLESCCKNFAALRMSGPNAFPLILSRVLAVGSVETSAHLLGMLLEHASTPEHVALCVESLLSAAWQARQSEDVLRVSSQLRAVLEARLGKAGRGNVVRRVKAIAAAIACLIARAPRESAPIECFIELFSSKSLTEKLEAEDLAAMLTALLQSRNRLLPRVLQVLVEMNSRLVTGKCSGMLIRVLSMCERELIFGKPSTLGSLERIQTAMELARVGEGLKQHEAAFKHLVLGALSDHITLSHYEGVDHPDLKRALDLFAFSLLDLCGHRELQQLHAVLGGGAGGARREVLKRLTKDYEKHYAFKGKV